MAGPGLTIVRRIRTLLGDDRSVTTDPTGLPCVAPPNVEALALVLRTAADEGWRARIQGAGTWMPADTPADLAIATTALDKVTRLDAADLVVTADAGVRWSALRDALADHGMWIGIDPPGDDRTLGSVIATGTAGPLRAGLGNVRDHLLGLTLVTGAGQVVHAGGRVVKNVAGFDLTRLAAGSFGAFGVITSATVKLRAVPRSDLTFVAHGARDRLLAAGEAILDEGLTPAATQLLSPQATQRDDWTLAIRLLGPDAGVRHEKGSVQGATELPLSDLPGPDAARLWHLAATGATSGPLTLRIGTLTGALPAALDLVEHDLPEGWISVDAAAAGVRWSGAATVASLRVLRHAAAEREMPMTLERAPWPVRSQLGVFGAYREGVGRLVAGLRETFDPVGVLVSGIDAL